MWNTRTYMCIEDIFNDRCQLNFIKGREYEIDFDGGYMFAKGEVSSNMVGADTERGRELFRKHFKEK